jgi:hypothetical protein
VVPEPDHAIAVLSKLGRSCRVLLGPSGVLATIPFDHQATGRAGEVGNMIADGVLSAKSPRPRRLAQRAPKQPLDVGGVAAQATR